MHRTTETRGRWNAGKASGALADVAFASTVDELADGWAGVFLVRSVDQPYRSPAEAANDVPALGLYLHYVQEEGDWRVHRLSTPDLGVADLTS